MQERNGDESGSIMNQDRELPPVRVGHVQDLPRCTFEGAKVVFISFSEVIGVHYLLLVLKQLFIRRL